MPILAKEQNTMNQSEQKAVTDAGFEGLDDLLEFAQTIDPDARVSEIPIPEDVHQAVLAVMARVGYVQKEESNNLSYSFASEPAFIRAIRPHMVDEGLYIRPVRMEEIGTDTFQAKSGATINSRRVLVVWQIVHAPSGTSIEISTIGEGMDVGDKATNKAMTVAYKYALRQTFLIETGDDPDYDPAENYEREQAAARERSNRANDRAGSKASGVGPGERVENQWEAEVVDAIVNAFAESDPPLARPHVVNILNYSIFRSSVPYGDLQKDAGLAYVLAWQDAKARHEDDDTEMRAKRVNSNWDKIKVDFYKAAADILAVGDAPPY
jgi:hypothetical protein